METCAASIRDKGSEWWSSAEERGGKKKQVNREIMGKLEEVQPQTTEV